METIGVVLKVTGASAFVTDLNKASTAIDKVYATAAKGGASFSVLNSTMNSAATVINTVAKQTTILSAAQVTAALRASDLKNKNTDGATAVKGVGTAANTTTSAFEKHNTVLGTAAAKLSDAKDKADDARSKFSSLSGITSKVVSGLQDIGRTAGAAVVGGLESASNAVQDFASKTLDVLGGLAGKAVDVGKDFIVNSVKVAGDFDSAMRVIQATSDTSAADMKKLTDSAIEMGIKFPVSTTDVAKGYGELSKAGFNANQILAAGPGLVTLGVAANLDSAKSSEILAGTIRGFGLAAEDTNKVVDILAQTANASSVDITDLGQTFKYAAPAAQAMGFSLEDVSIASGILGNSMIKGSSAGTGLATIFSRLAAPPKDAAAAIEALGLKITDSAGKVRPLRDILGELREKFSGLSQVEQLDLAKKLAGQDAAKSLLTIINASTKDWDGMTQAIDHAGGSAEKMATVMSGGTKGALDNLSGSVEALQIKLGTALAPALLFVVGKLSEFANVASLAFSEIMMGIGGKEYKQGAEKMTTPFIEFGKTLKNTVLPAIKTVSDFIFNTVIPVAGQIAIVLLTQVIPAVIGFATKLGTFLAPIIANVANFVTGTLIPGVMKFASEAAPIVVGAVQAIGGFISTVLIPAVISLANYWSTTLVPALTTAANWISANLVPVIISIANTISTDVLPAVGRFGDFIVTNVLPKLESFANWFGVTVLPVISQFIGFIADSLIPTIGKIAAVILDTVIPTITNWVGVIATVLTPIITALVDFISGTVIPVFTNISNFIGNTLVPAFQKIGAFINANVMPVLTTLAGFLGGALTVAFQNIGTVVSGVWNTIQTVIQTVWTVVQGVFNTIKSVLSGDFAGAWTGFQSVVKGVWDGVSSLIGIAWGTIKGIFDNITGFLGGTFKGAWDAIKTAIETVWTGIVTAVTGAKGGLDKLFDGIKSAIDAVGVVWNTLVDTVKKGAAIAIAVAQGDWGKAWDLITGKAESGAADASKAVDKLGNDIANKDFSAAASKAGSTIGQGMAAGIKGVTQSVVNAAASMAQQAIDAAKQRLRSESPSKVMIQEGRNFTEGFGIGVEKYADLATGPVETVIGQIVDTPSEMTPLMKYKVDQFLEPILDISPRINNIIGGKDDPASPLFILLQTLEQITGDSAVRMNGKIGQFIGALGGLKTGIDSLAPGVKGAMEGVVTVIGKVIDDKTPDIEDGLKPIPEAVDKTGKDITVVGNGPADAMAAVLAAVGSAVDTVGAQIVSKLNSILSQITALVNSIVAGVNAANAAAASAPGGTGTNGTGNNPSGSAPTPAPRTNPPPDSGGVLLPMYAGGTRRHKGGKAFVADEGPEIVKSNGQAYLIMIPSILDLAAGSEVYTAAKTRDLIASGGGRVGSPASASQIYNSNSQVNNNTTNNNYNLALNSNLDSSGPIADYDLMKMLI